MPKKLTQTKNGNLTYEEDKFALIGVEHKCLHGNKVIELHKAVTGNGSPEEGIVYKLSVIKGRQDGVLLTLDKIDTTLKEMHTFNYGLLSEITEVRASVGNFRAEMTGKERAEKEAEEKRIIKETLEATKRRDRNWRIGQVVVIVLMTIGLYFSFRGLHNGQKAIQDETKITNDVLIPTGRTRGAIYIPINDTTKIKEDRP
jgi:hypothetical protein